MDDSLDPREPNAFYDQDGSNVGLDVDALFSNSDASDAGEAGDEPQEIPGDPPAEDEVVITLGDERIADEDAAPEDLTPKASAAWARMRIEKREAAKRARELAQQLEDMKSSSAAPAQHLAEKPTYAGSNYNDEEFEANMARWHEQQAAKKAEQDEWQGRVASYESSKAALKVPDFEDAEAAAKGMFSIVQQGVLLKGAAKPAELIYALGKSPAKARELAAIKDPVSFAVAIGRLESQLKVTQRKAVPQPEVMPGRSSGGAGASLMSGSRLEEMRLKAAKSGDYTAYFVAKRAAEKK